MSLLIAPTAPASRRARRRQGRLRRRCAAAPLRGALLDRVCARRSASNAVGTEKRRSVEPRN